MSALSAFLLPLAQACANESLLLATVPDTLEAGLPAVDARRCTERGECPTTAFCARARCEDVGGSCALLPVVCEESASPVCGCDGVTYWNDCLRRASGITAATPGECAGRSPPCGGRPDPWRDEEGGRAPDVSSGCPSGTFCARLLPSSDSATTCARDVPGTCWALPAVCTDIRSPDRWEACGARPSPCITTCEAIRSGRPHRRARACP